MKKKSTLTELQRDRIIEMAWEDRTHFRSVWPQRARGNYLDAKRDEAQQLQNVAGKGSGKKNKTQATTRSRC